MRNYCVIVRYSENKRGFSLESRDKRLKSPQFRPEPLLRKRNLLGLDNAVISSNSVIPSIQILFPIYLVLDSDFSASVHLSPKSFRARDSEKVEWSKERYKMLLRSHHFPSIN